MNNNKNIIKIQRKTSKFSLAETFIFLSLFFFIISKAQLIYLIQYLAKPLFYGAVIWITFFPAFFCFLVIFSNSNFLDLLLLFFFANFFLEISWDIVIFSPFTWSDFLLKSWSKNCIYILMKIFCKKACKGINTWMNWLTFFFNFYFKVLWIY